MGYHFCNAHPDIPNEPDLDAFLMRFVAGSALDIAQATAGGALLGGIAAHQRAYLEAAQRGQPVHFVSYENLHRDPENTLHKLAAFLGSTMQHDDIARLQAQASFESMKSAARAREVSRRTPLAEVFWRSSTVGDWHNTLTDAQGARVDEAFAEPLAP